MNTNTRIRNTQRSFFIQSNKKTKSSSGKNFTIFISLASIFLSIGFSFFIFNKKYYQTLRDFYDLTHELFKPTDFLKIIYNSFGDKCESYIVGTLVVPCVLLFFAFWNFASMFVAWFDLSCCGVIQFFFAILYGCFALFYSQMGCGSLYSQLLELFGSDKMPEPAWPYFAGMAFFSLLNAAVNCVWNSNKIRAEQEKKNLSLLADAENL